MLPFFFRRSALFFCVLCCFFLCFVCVFLVFCFCFLINLLDAEMLAKDAGVQIDRVADSDDGKVHAVAVPGLRVDGGRARGSVARAKHVHAHLTTAKNNNNNNPQK
jgi:hypothetical protein